jgi:hypothetical protein
MNANVMIQNREYQSTYVHYDTQVTLDLLKMSSKFYREPLTPSQVLEIKRMDLQDKLWLLDQYKQEIKEYPPADLENIY